MKVNTWEKKTFSGLINAGLLMISDGYRAKNEELGGDGYIFLRSGHVTDAHIDLSGVERFRKNLAGKVASKLSKTGDVIITTKGNSTGRVAYMTPDLPQVVYSPHLSFWRSLNHNVLVPGFLRYWSRSREFQGQLDGMKSSTDMAPYLSLIDQKRLRITLPKSEEQKGIARILGALDDKIDLNRQMNQTLEAMAQALFQSWFVDFDPVAAKAAGHKPFGMNEATAALFPDRFLESELGLIPAGWSVGTIGQISEIIDCLHSKKPERQAEGKPLLQLWNIRDDGLVDMSDPYFISEADYGKWISRMEAVEGDCIITNVGRVGACAQIPMGLRAALGRNMTGIHCRREYPYPTFLLQCLLSQAMKEEIALKTDTGTILDALNVKDIPRLRLNLPIDELLILFETKCRPLRAKMEQNTFETKTLATLRDALLPKLLSGEIRVRQAEKLVAEAV